MKRRYKFIIPTLVLVIAFVLPGFLNYSHSQDKNDFSIPILMYHSISEDERGLFKVSKDNFYKHMRYLKDNGYKTLSLDDLYSNLTKGVPFSDKSIVITFDDGYSDNYKNAYPILKEFGFKATIFVITDYIADKSYFMSKDQLKEVNLNGIDIESHTTNHSKLDKLSKEDRVKNLKESKNSIEKLLKKEVKYISYPFGKYSKEVIEDLKDGGYKMAVTTKGGVANISVSDIDELYKLKRVFISGYTDVKGLRKKIER